jgi:hypothetical protein
MNRQRDMKKLRVAFNNVANVPLKRGLNATDYNILWHKRFACWITKATDTHSEYVILTAFQQQQLLHKHASMLRSYAHCLSCYDVQIKSCSLYNCYTLDASLYTCTDFSFNLHGKSRNYSKSHKTLLISYCKTKTA